MSVHEPPTDVTAVKVSEESSSPEATAVKSPPRPLDRIERRILGVLVEKAKTTPDAYPMSLNALLTGCNQKSNRDPQMSLTDADVESGLERLRQIGAVAEVQGNGRVPRYRHYMYEFLGVDKVELAVMAELLLRGAQTVGELRGRAARMEAITDLAALLPVVRTLIGKGLVVPLTAEGRGQIVTHALYRPEELEKVRRNLPAAAPDTGDDVAYEDVPRGPATTRFSPAPPQPAFDPGELAQLRDELQEVRDLVEKLRGELDDLRTHLGV
jgi:uncharacterized protein YceH (UPF0502 family)